MKIRKHWIFHKYKWETYHTAPVFVTGFFQDYTLQRQFQCGTCECGANKYREIDVNLEDEIEMATIKWQLNVAKELEKRGEIDKAIEVLKVI